MPPKIAVAAKAVAAAIPAAAAEPAVTEELGWRPDPSYRIKGLFRNDLYAFCKQLGAQMHSQLLPSAEPPAAADSHSVIPEPTWMRSDAKEADEGTRRVADEPEARPNHTFDFTVREEVRVVSIPIQPDTFTAFVAALKASSHTTKVSLHNAALTVDQLHELAKVLAHTQITELCIESNSIPDALIPQPDAAAPPIAEAAGALSGATTARAGKAGAAVSEPPAAVEAAPRPPRFWHVWSLFLRRGLPLRKLVLRGNSLSAHDARWMAEALCLNSSCAELVISDNPLGDEGIGALSAGLRENRSLRVLSIANTGMSAASVTGLLESVSTFALSVDQVVRRLALESRLAAEAQAAAASVGNSGSPLKPPAPAAPSKGAAAPAAVAAVKGGKPGAAAASAAESYELPLELRFPQLRALPLAAGGAAASVPNGKPPAAATKAPVEAGGSSAGGVTSGVAVHAASGFTLAELEGDAERLFQGWGNTGLRVLDVSRNLHLGPAGVLALGRQLLAALPPPSTPAAAESKEHDASSVGGGRRRGPSAGGMRPITPKGSTQAATPRAQEQHPQLQSVVAMRCKPLPPTGRLGQFAAVHAASLARRGLKPALPREAPMLGASDGEGFDGAADDAGSEAVSEGVIGEGELGGKPGRAADPRQADVDALARARQSEKDAEEVERELPELCEALAARGVTLFL